ncbi:hypothetical protein CPAR01_15765 [Colletotrichum paranaense]|uniref:Secreted protein n=1 Tax=Colletotrichum paranaense TaxID=1914294 RepID=A0ABQ9RYL0_9PEZI|nr:uncharacterized protein CPAR01_15765 [Colletotrichum paranaense]KAK1518116.1 hypothetical protein CPAR01_15765 [Colletotrichum paranaense]
MDVDCLYFFSLLLWLLLVGPSRWTACVKLCRPSTGATSTSVQQASLFLLVSQSATPETPKAKVKRSDRPLICPGPWPWGWNDGLWSY